jgi:hypothetical protein
MTKYDTESSLRILRPSCQSLNKIDSSLMQQYVPDIQDSAHNMMQIPFIP